MTRLTQAGLMALVDTAGAFRKAGHRSNAIEERIKSTLSDCLTPHATRIVYAGKSFVARFVPEANVLEFDNVIIHTAT